MITPSFSVRTFRLTMLPEVGYVSVAFEFVRENITPINDRATRRRHGGQRPVIPKLLGFIAAIYAWVDPDWPCGPVLGDLLIEALQLRGDSPFVEIVGWNKSARN